MFLKMRVIFTKYEVLEWRREKHPYTHKIAHHQQSTRKIYMISFCAAGTRRTVEIAGGIYLASPCSQKYILKIRLDVDPGRDDDASPMSSYRCLLRPT